VLIQYALGTVQYSCSTHMGLQRSPEHCGVALWVPCARAGPRGGVSLTSCQAGAQEGQRQRQRQSQRQQQGLHGEGGGTGGGRKGVS